MSLDFSASARHSLWAWALLVLGLAGSAHALWQRHDLLAGIAEKKEVISRQEKQAQQEQWDDQSSTAGQSPASAKATALLATELNRPWEQMLDALREVAGKKIQLTRVQPDGEGGLLQITGRADEPKEFLAYMTRLRESGHWRSVQPVSHESASDGMGYVSFQLMLEWQQ